MPAGNYKYKVPRAFDHVQSTASTQWVITIGGAGGIPVIDILVDTGEPELTKIIPKKITMVSPTEVHVDFTTPYSGIARVVV